MVLGVDGSLSSETALLITATGGHRSDGRREVCGRGKGGKGNEMPKNGAGRGM